MKIKIPPMPPADDVTGITLNKVREARDQQWLDLVAPVVEALQMVQEAAIKMRGLDFNLTVEQWANFHAALRAITEEQS